MAAYLKKPFTYNPLIARKPLIRVKTIAAWIKARADRPCGKLDDATAEWQNLPVDQDRIQPALVLVPRPQVGRLPSIDDVDGEAGQRGAQRRLCIIHEEPSFG